MTIPDGSSMLTPRTDAAERFFIDPGRPPVGYVSSSLARILEVELGRALAALAQFGAQAPPALDKSSVAALQAAKRPSRGVLDKIDISQPQSAASPAAPQAQNLRSALANADLGQPRSYEDGAVLFRRGEQAENIFLILSGQVQVSQRQAFRVDCNLGPGHVLGAHILFDESMHTETVHALGTVQVLLLGGTGLRQKLATDSSMLTAVLMGLSLQQQMVSELSWQASAGQAVQSYDLLGERTYTGPELQRQLLAAKAQEPGEGMSGEQIMCLHLQAGEQLPLQVVRSGESLGQAGQPSGGSALMIVSGKVRARWGELTVVLGQGAVIGLAEALSAQAFAWDYDVLQDLNARQWPIERALQQLERAEPLWRALAGHLCAGIVKRQQEALG